MSVTHTDPDPLLDLGRGQQQAQAQSQARSRSRSSSFSSIASDQAPTFEGLAPTRPPTTTDHEEKILVIPGLSKDVRLMVDAGPGCGGIAWPAGEVLSRYLAYRHGFDPGKLQGKTILELGSGTGLVGLVAAMLEPSANVWISDQRILLNLMQANADLNQIPAAQIHVVEYNWGEPCPPIIPKPNVILAADCVYFEPAFPLLVATLCELVPIGEDVELLFCWKKRRKADRRFFALLKKHFHSESVEDDKPGEKERYNREGVTLSRLIRRR